MKKHPSSRILSFSVGLFFLAGILMPVLFTALQTSASGAGYSASVLSNCDSLDGWNIVDGPGNLAVDTTGQQEGAGAIRFFDQAGGTVGELSKNLYFETAKDLSILYSDPKKALQIWVKVSNVSALNQLAIDVVDADGMSGTALTWDWNHMKRYEYAPTKFADDQWVKLLITPDSRNYTHGGATAPDFSKIKMISVKAYKSASLPLSVSIDHIAVVDAVYTYPVDSCDTLDGWFEISGWMQRFTTGQHEGNGMISISNGAPNPTNVITKVFPEPVNMTPITRANDMQLEIWMKIDNPDGVADIRIDLVSSAGLTGNNFTYAGYGKAWSFPGTSFSAGEWKKITIRAFDPAFHEWNGAGSIDYSDIRYLAINTNTKDGGLVDVHVDAIRLADVSTSYMLDDGTDHRNWTAEAWRGATSDGGAGHNGGAAVKLADTNPAVPYYSMSLLPRGGVDLSSMKSAVDKELVFWVKVSNAEALTAEGVYIFLSSEGSLSGGAFNWTKGVRYQIPKDAFEDQEWLRFAINPSTPISHDWGGYEADKTVNIQFYIPLAGTLIDFYVSEVALTDHVVEPVEPDVTILGGNDSLNGWIATSGAASLDKNAPKEGSASVKLSGNPDQALMMKKLTTKPENLAAMGVQDGKALTFWVRVENVENLSKLEIDLADQSGVDEGGNLRWTPGLKRWIFTPDLFESGEWVKLQITDFDANLFNPWGNTLDYSKIVYFGVNAYLETGGTNLALSLDDFTLSDPPPAVPAKILDSNDTLLGWTATVGEAVLNNTDPKEGSGAVVLRGNPEEALMMHKIPTDYENLAPMGVKDDKALSMWVRVDNADALREMHIDLADNTGLNPDGSLKWNQGLKRWIFTGDDFVSGEWVKLSLTDFDANIFNVWNNTLDYSKIAYLGFVVYVKNANDPLRIDIDDIHLGEVPPLPPVTLEDNCDKIWGFTASVGTLAVDKTAPAEGKGNLVLKGDPDEALVMYKSMTTPQNVAGMAVRDDKALSMWVKVSDVSKIKLVTIDLTDVTGLNPDGSRIWNAGLKRWEFSPDYFKSGEWVQIQMTDFDLNIFNVWNNTLDYSQIIRMDLLVFVSSPGDYVEFAFDNIAYGDFTGELKQATADDNCDSHGGWNAKMGQITYGNTDPQEGTGYLTLFGAPEEALIMQKKLDVTDSFVGLDMLGFRKYTFWVRAKDASVISEFYIDLVSEGGLDPNGERNWLNCKRWIFPGSALKTGEWVKLEITGLDTNMEPDWAHNVIDYDNIIMVYLSVYSTTSNAYLEVDFDDFKVEKFPEGPEIPGEVEEPPIDHQDILRPVITDANVAKLLNYKIIVAEGTTLAKLRSVTTLDSDYTMRVLSGEDEIEDSAVLKTGMWLVISKEKLDVAAYYVEVGNPADTTGIADVPMEGRPDTVSPDTESPQTGDMALTGSLLLLFFSAAAVVYFTLRKKRGQVCR